MAEDLSFFVRNYEGTKIIEISGNLDVNTVGTFSPLVERITQKESVMINMEKIGLVTAAGVRALVDVSFSARRAGRRVILLWPSDDLVGMAETIEVYNYLIFAFSLEEGKTKITFFT